MGLLVACPKAGACPNVVCPKTPGTDAPKAGPPNPELPVCGVAVAVLVMLPVCCPNGLGAVLAATGPNMGVAEGAVAVLLESWLNAELELAAGGCAKTEEPEVTVPNTAAVSAAGALLGTVLGVVGAPDASMVTGPAPGRVAAACSDPAKAEAGDVASVLSLGPPEAPGVASAGTERPAGGAGVLELLSAGCARTGSFLAGSEVCRGDWGGGADCGCTGSEAAGVETSDTAEDVTPSVLLPEDMVREGAGVAELRRPPKDKVGKEDGRAVEADVGAEGDTVLLACWFPNEKVVLLPVRPVPPKLIIPEGPALVKTPVEELLELELAVVGGTAGVGVMEEVTGALEKLKTGGTFESLVGWTLSAEALLADFEESSAWPTRSPEKLPSVSPAREVGKRKSPNLDGGVSSLLGVDDRAIPEGAAGLRVDGTGSPGEAVAAADVLGTDATPAEGAFPGVGSQKGLPPPPNENASSWLDSLVGGAAPGAELKFADGVGAIIPKLKPVPDEAKQKGLFNCPTAEVVEVTAVSALAVAGPEALSPDDK